MWIVIILLIIAAFVVYKMGVFRKPGVCRHCNKPIKGIEQVVFKTDDSSFILCKECAKKITPQIREFAKNQWVYEDYTDYLKWAEETKEERAQFAETDTYDGATTFYIDRNHALFKIGYDGEVLRFKDVGASRFMFEETGTTDDGLPKGSEKVQIIMDTPSIVIQETILHASKAQRFKEPLPGSRHEFLFSAGFGKIARLFSACHLMELAKLDGKQADDPLELATAMFIYCFNEVEDITAENIERQQPIVDNIVASGQFDAAAVNYAKSLLLKYAQKS